MFSKIFFIKLCGICGAVLIAVAGISVLQNHTANKSDFFEASTSPSSKTDPSAENNTVASATESTTQTTTNSNVLPQDAEQETVQQQVFSTTDESSQTATQQYAADNTLKKLLSGSSYSIDDFNFNQLIVVDTNGTAADVSLFNKDANGNWTEDICNAEGCIGKKGITSNKTEGDGCTPMGLYSIGEAFYQNDPPPHTRLSVFKITNATYWVNDPASMFYNQKVTGTSQKDWNQAEHMADYPESYKYGFVINYNTNPVIANAGSAIFMHCGNQPTSGCISVGEDDLLDILSMLDADANPHILII